MGVESLRHMFLMLFHVLLRCLTVATQTPTCFSLAEVLVGDRVDRLLVVTSLFVQTIISTLQCGLDLRGLDLCGATSGRLHVRCVGTSFSLFFVDTTPPRFPRLHKFNSVRVTRPCREATVCNCVGVEPATRHTTTSQHTSRGTAANTGNFTTFSCVFFFKARRRKSRYQLAACGGEGGGQDSYESSLVCSPSHYTAFRPRAPCSY